MVVGAGMTFVVQSSSVFTSAITPLIGECPYRGGEGLAGTGLSGARGDHILPSAPRPGCDQHRACLPPHTGLQYWHHHHGHPGCTGQSPGEAVQRLPGVPEAGLGWDWGVALTQGGITCNKLFELLTRGHPLCQALWQPYRQSRAGAILRTLASTRRM